MAINPIYAKMPNEKQPICILSMLNRQLPVCKRGEPHEKNIGDIRRRSPKRKHQTIGRRLHSRRCWCWVSLNQVEVKSCIGCNTCRYGKPCVQKDGFSELVPKIKAADLLVFASPLLFWTISAKLKAIHWAILLPRRGRHESAIRTVWEISCERCSITDDLCWWSILDIWAGGVVLQIYNQPLHWISW